MVDLLRSATTGQYPSPGWDDLTGAQYVAVLAFGDRKEGDLHAPEPINQELARRAIGISGMLEGLPIIAQGEIADIIEGHENLHVAKRIDSHRKEGRYLDTAEYLEQVAEHVAEKIDDLKLGVKGIAVAQAFHVGRVVAQGKKAGLDLIPAGDLPRDFDPESTQWWTRSRALWIMREIPVIAAFKLKGKL